MNKYIWSIVLVVIFSTLWVFLWLYQRDDRKREEREWHATKVPGRTWTMLHFMVLKLSSWRELLIFRGFRIFAHISTSSNTTLFIIRFNIVSSYSSVLDVQCIPQVFKHSHILCCVSVQYSNRLPVRVFILHK